MTNREQSERIGRRIAALRIERGMTQTELARRAGIQRPHLVRIEQGQLDLRLSVMTAIARELGVDVDLT